MYGLRRPMSLRKASGSDTFDRRGKGLWPSEKGWRARGFGATEEAELSFICHAIEVWGASHHTLAQYVRLVK